MREDKLKKKLFFFERSQKKKQRRKSEREKWAMETEKRGSRQLVTIEKGGLGKYERWNKW